MALKASGNRMVSGLSKVVTLVAAWCVASSALATITGTITLQNFPSNVTVGQTFTGVNSPYLEITANIVNDSAVVSNITISPSCSAISGTTCTLDPGVFKITNVRPGPGVLDGFPDNACDLIFSGGGLTVTPANYANGPATTITINTDTEVDIGGAAQLNYCRIDFDLEVVGTPAVDADTGTPGIQTNQLATVHFDSEDFPGTNTGGASTTHVATFPTPVGRPLFVIGDVEPHAVGDNVNFWGSQWWKNNIMSGVVNAGYPAFKGYADQADTTCGGTWTTLPGNSSNPPDTIPADVLVIVTDTVHKNGPNISGTIKQILTVHSDGDYGPAPGHRGNGVVSVVNCP